VVFPDLRFNKLVPLCISIYRSDSKAGCTQVAMVTEDTETQNNIMRQATFMMPQAWYMQHPGS
jgi:hypothetical protein